MSLAQGITTYVSLNLMILLAYGGLGFVSFALRRANKRMAAPVELKLHYYVLSVILVLAAAHPLLPKSEVFAPAAKVWSAQSMKSFDQEYSARGKSGYLSLPSSLGRSTLQAERVALTWIALGAILLLIGSFFFFRDLRALLRARRSSFVIKRIGRARILVSDSIQVPFSYWFPGQANIVIPSALVDRGEYYKMAVVHELQHHRHGDTRWVYIMWGLKLICVINPAVYFWNRWISEIQEFACDETLVDQGKVESQAYARCLIEVAQTAIERKQVPVCATGLVFLNERKLLKRRIEKMFSKSSTKISRSISITVGLFIASVMGVTAFASKGLVHDRRVSRSQAEAMAARAQSETGFPIVVNDLVLTQLNRYIGTPEGREFMRDSLARMESYRQVVEEHLQKHRIPEEIVAVPIVESGYRNLTQRQSGTAGRAAGLWQFIPATARNYGLRVDDQTDERLDVALSTDAAMRYIQSNNLRFKDWHLALLAYNMGERAVQRAMDDLGTRSAWVLIRNGREGDKNYLAKFDGRDLDFA